MPIVTFHLVEGTGTAAQNEELLRQSSRLYADILSSPLERIRAFLTLRPAGQVAVGGELASINGLNAPFFDFYVLQGRPPEQRRQLHAAFTDLLVTLYGIDRTLIRGRSHQIAPDDWSIGGVPAGAVRRDELAARQSSSP